MTYGRGLFQTYDSSYTHNNIDNIYSNTTATMIIFLNATEYINKRNHFNSLIGYGPLG